MFNACIQIKVGKKVVYEGVHPTDTDVTFSVKSLTEIAEKKKGRVNLTKKTLEDTWHVQDIIERAKEQHDLDIDEKDALEVLEYLDSHYSAELGINWEIIDIAINNVICD